MRERHTLKGAGVRVSSVAGQQLSTLARPTPGASLASPPIGDSDSHAGGEGPHVGYYPGDGTTAAVVSCLPPAPPTELLEAVGSGVISVSPGGVAVVEHLGRSAADAGTREAGGSGAATTSGDFDPRQRPSADENVRSTAEFTGEADAGGSGQHEASASLWRLRAARRRRQARGDKMRTLVALAAGGGRGRDEGVIGPGVSGSVIGGKRGGTVSGRAGGGAEAAAVRSGVIGLAGGGDRARGRMASAVPAAASTVSRAGGLGTDGPAGADREGPALGWGVKLQARAAMAIPASFLSKRG